MSQLRNFSTSDLERIAHDAVQSAQPIKNMTCNYYFRVVKYAISGIDKSVLSPAPAQLEQEQKRMRAKAVANNLNPDMFMSTDVYAYNKYTAKWVGDAIDNFGTIVGPDCPADFNKWFDVCAYNGGHPFEIYPYVCLYVRREKGGFYLELADFYSSEMCPSEKVLKMFLALRANDVSVALRDKKLLLEKIEKYNLLNR